MHGLSENETSECKSKAKIEANMKTIAGYKQTMLLVNNIEDHFQIHLHNKDFFGCRKDFERLVLLICL